MSDPMIGVLVIFLMFVFIAIRVPIAIAMVAPAILGILYLGDWQVLVSVVDLSITNNSLSYMMTTIAMFVLMGELMNISGISSQLYHSFKTWFGKLRGGLAMATVMASSLFAASSGSSIATTASIGTIASKEMLGSNYSRTITSGSILAGGTLGILIPPSTFMVLYGVLAQQHIGQLLIAGILPGVILTVLFLFTVFIFTRLIPQSDETGETYSLAERIKSLTSAIPILVLFTFVIGGLYIGIFGPTEAASMGAVGALIIALLKKSISFQSLTEALSKTLKTVGFIFAILLAALILNSFIVQSGLPSLLNNYLSSLTIAPVFIFIIIVLMYIILGAFMDAMAAMLVTFPIVLPLVEALGYDLIWFGVVMCLLMELAMISPPIGLNIFVLDGVSPELGIPNIYKGALVFMVPIIVLIVLIYVFPEIVLFLPGNL